MDGRKQWVMAIGLIIAGLVVVCIVRIYDVRCWLNQAKQEIINPTSAEEIIPEDDYDQERKFLVANLKNDYIAIVAEDDLYRLPDMVESLREKLSDNNISPKEIGTTKELLNKFALADDEREAYDNLGHARSWAYLGDVSRYLKVFQETRHKLGEVYTLKHFGTSKEEMISIYKQGACAELVKKQEEKEKYKGLDSSASVIDYRIKFFQDRCSEPEAFLDEIFF